MATETKATAETKPARSLRSRVIRVLLAIVVFLVGAFVYRMTSLRGLPEIPPPFDHERGGFIHINPEDNAFTYYARAHEQLKGIEPGTMKGVYSDWLDVDPTHLAYADDNRQALETWFEGTKRTRAVYHQPGTVNFATEVPVTLTVRNISRSANLIGYRHEHEGDLAKAWDWYRANLRASRHVGQDGEIIGRCVGIAVYHATSSAAIHWSKNTKVTIPQLKRALNDVLEINALTVSRRDLVRTAYFSLTNSLEDHNGRERLLEVSLSNLATPAPPTFVRSIKIKAMTAYGALKREPERSRRVIRLEVANWLAAADLPTSELAKRAVQVKELTLYEPSPGETPPLSLDDLAAWFDTTLYAKLDAYMWVGLDRALSRDEQSQAALIIHLAEEIYTRENGKPPKAAQDLVGTYLKKLPVGFDPSGSATSPAPKPATP